MATNDGDEGFPLEPDSISTLGDGSDSGLGLDDIESSRSASLTSSIADYQYENGRRYHAYREGSYLLPNDETEQARLDLSHHIFRLALDGALYAAPLLKPVERCLDFGTGTGIWAIDFADEYPSAEVVGTDLSPIQPTWVPSNLKFFVDDVEASWGYRPDEAFDFIHGRGMEGAIADWVLLFRQIYDNLKPGGSCEMQEYGGSIFSIDDPTLSKTPNLKEWVELVNKGLISFGKELDVAPKLKKLMEDAGFLDVTEKIVKIPIGPWTKDRKTKEMGRYQREHICDCVDSYTVALFTRVLGWRLEECQVLMAKCKNEVRDPRNHLYAQFWFVYGGKPSS